jgi:hypothetical protein
MHQNGDCVGSGPVAPIVFQILPAYTMAMKLSAAFVLAAMMTFGQRGPESQIVDRLDSDLAALRRLPNQEMLDPSQLAASDRAALRTNLEIQNPGQTEAMSTIVGDLRDRYGEPILSWDSAYVLTTALAGKVLENNSLTAFTRSFVKSLDNAAACSRIRMPVRSCKQFQDSAEQMYAALLPLGISTANAQIVVENLIRNGDRLASQKGPLFQPIPRARPATPIVP